MRRRGEGSAICLSPASTFLLANKRVRSERRCLRQELNLLGRGRAAMPLDPGAAAPRSKSAASASAEDGGETDVLVRAMQEIADHTRPGGRLRRSGKGH